jgi:CheY-like chemotaxis protein
MDCIIDNAPTTFFGTKKLMELTNFCDSFLIFHNGKEAIDHLKPIIELAQKMPELILLDLNMPIMDGWNF